MAIATDLADPAARERVDQLIKVGFSPRQAFALEAGSWTLAKLHKRGLFDRHEAGTLLGSPTVAQLITKAHMTRHQAELVFRLYID